MRATIVTAMALVSLLGCSSHPARPQRPDPRIDLCNSCRMPVSDPSLAAQIVAPNEEPRFFDDLRCLRDYLATERARPPGAVVYVADHRTRDWVEASRAVFAQAPGLQTPMDSHWVAYADENSRLADRGATGSASLPAAEIFGPAGHTEPSPEESR